MLNSDSTRFRHNLRGIVLEHIELKLFLICRPCNSNQNHTCVGLSVTIDLINF